MTKAATKNKARLSTQPGDFTTPSGPSGNPFVVCLASSAGGLKPLETFFGKMPADSGIAFVLAAHLDPDHKSMLAEIIGRHTRMPVLQATDGAKLERDTVFVIPPGRGMSVEGGALRLVERPKSPIDRFLQTLAVDQHERAIAVILSGTGRDGAVGLKAIKEFGGLVLVQDPATAEFAGMPASAIATGATDVVLSVADMPERIIAFVKKAAELQSATFQPESATAFQPETLQQVLHLLRSHSGHDFTHYKQNTIRRRLERRMIVQQVTSLPDYVRYLEAEPVERERLLKELLIGVTSFFRDPEAFEVLKERVVPHLIDHISPGGGIRVWVSGCSTGEEAYSIAMLLKEVCGDRPGAPDFRVFASDIDKDAIEVARDGRYPESIASEVSQVRLDRFFTRERDGYRVRKELRERVIFAIQDVNRDPPFSKIDLISCRNLMIYLEPVLQKKLLRVFHYALNMGGILFMGSSETVGEGNGLFSPFDKRWKFFERKGAVPYLRHDLDFDMPSYPRTLSSDRISAPEPRRPSIREVAHDVLLAHFVPPSVLCTETGDILYVHGKTGDYLEPATGEAKMNVLLMARADLKLELSRGVQKALALKETVRYAGLRLKKLAGAGVSQTGLDLTIRPLADVPYHQRLVLVSFEEKAGPLPVAEAIALEEGKDPAQRATRLERELLFTKEHTQSLVEQLETSNEELKSTNEELQSSNEELQSSNEELETVKEELQAVNEELVTLNAELQVKIEELSTANSDLDNFLASSSIVTIFLDRNFLITRFSRSTTKVFHLIPSDVGRSIGDIASQLRYDSILEDAEEVLASLLPCERIVESKDGRWLFMRMTPYKTMSNVIDGVVIGFMEMTEQRRLETQAALLRLVIERATVAAVTVDARRRIDYVSKPFLALLGWRDEDLAGKDVAVLGLAWPSQDGDPMQRLLQLGGLVSGAVEVKDKSGATRQLQAIMTGGAPGQGVALIIARESLNIK